RQEDHRVALSEAVDARELCPVVVQRLAVAARVEEADQLRREIDDVRAMGGGDLLQVGRRLALDLRRGSIELARQPCDAAPERGRGEDVLAQEARPLVAQPAHPALGALERERRLPYDEFGEPGGLTRGRPARMPPAVAQLRGGCRLALDDAEALGAKPSHP